MFLIAGLVSIVVLHALLLPVKKKDPVPDPFVHYTPFFSLFTTGLSPALVRTTFPASSSGFWCSGVKNELPSAFSHCGSMFSLPTSRRVPCQVMHPAIVTAHRCALATHRACSGCAPVAPDGVGCLKGLRVG